MNSLSKLRQLQLVEVEALKEFVDFCNKNNLVYYLRGGSVLGAIKYNGMIPWDDDIDVVLPRKDYDRLIIIAPDNLNNYVFDHYSRNPKFGCYFARIYLDENKRCEMELPKNNANGLVLIDILPIDGMPVKKKSYIFLKLKVNILRLLASVHTLDNKETVVKRIGLKKIIPEILNKLKIHKIYKQVDIYKKLDKMYSKHSFESAEIVGVLAGSKSNKEIFPKKWLGNGVVHNFENLKVRVPEQSDKYLKLLFGEDYRKREPSQEDKIQKHFEGEL